MSALQRPQIAIFGSTSPDWTAPINPNQLLPEFNLLIQEFHYSETN